MAPARHFSARVPRTLGQRDPRIQEKVSCLRSPRNSVSCRQGNIISPVNGGAIEDAMGGRRRLGRTECKTRVPVRANSLTMIV
eukprot:4700525-Pyramimonas_sp.AAC.1